MPRYEVTQTATAEVWAKNEMEAIEYATSEFFAFPEYNHEVKDTTPQHNLEEIAKCLGHVGVSAYVDDYRNNAHDFIRLTVTHAHPDDDDNHYMLQVSLNDREEFDGKFYGLMDHDGLEVANFEGSMNPLVLATRVHRILKERANTEMKTTLEEIASNLNAMGLIAEVVDFGRYEGQPKVVEIVSKSENGYTLYQKLTDAETVSGEGYFLQTVDGEEVFNDIPNANAVNVAGHVAYNIGRADYDLESREAGK